MSQQRARIGVNCGTGILLGALWGGAWAAVEAAQDSRPPDLLSMPWAQLSIAVAITMGAGLAATWHRELLAEYANKPFDIARETKRDMMVSAAIGIGGYSLGWIWQAPAPLVALALILAGYGGTRVLRLALSRALDVIRRGGGGGLQ